MEAAVVKSIGMKPAKSAAIEPGPSMEPAAAVETSATGMRPSVGDIWMAERRGAWQSSCDSCQSRS